MQVVNSILRFRSRFTLSFLGVALIVGLMIVPSYFRSGAQRTRPTRGLKTVPNEPDLPNYDIRDDKQAAFKIAQFRAATAKTSADVDSLRNQASAGEEKLAAQVPTLKVEYNQHGIAEVISPDVKQGKAFLSSATSLRHSDILLDFVRDNSQLVGLASAQVDDQLKVFADYTNPNGDLSFVEINQEISGIPVFQGTVKAGFTHAGEMIRVINDLAPGIDNASVSADFGNPAAAINAAAISINLDPSQMDLKPNQEVSTDLKAAFGTSVKPTTAEKMYFPTEAGVAVPAWRVLIWEPQRAYYVVVDAQTGTLLWRKNISQDQTQSATYNVYTDDSPTPLSPSPNSITPLLGLQGTPISRTSVTVVGNEPPNTFNNLGWIPDGSNVTTGNNVDAGLDRVSPDGVDATGRATGIAGTSPANRNFVFNYNPGLPGASPTGDDPLTPANQMGAVTNIFYWTNIYHDRLYNVGFTEPARNFQTNNFGRGGLGNDAISAQAQDSSGTDNANFGTPADGTPGQMQMYIFSNIGVRRDGDLDADVFLHEMTHGLSNRLIGNANGLNTQQSAGMGEGWSDFYARTLLSTADEDVNGIYAAGGYATYQDPAVGVTTNNYYYGIRRFPYAVKTNVGTNGKPHNPLTYADIDPVQLNLNDGAFAPAFNNGAIEVHNEGEVWCMMLLEVRARIIHRLHFDPGNQRALQLITDAMKLTPLNPTFIQARDSIVAAARASSDPDLKNDVWAGFATRGLGFSATNPSGNTVVEAFDLPLRQTPDLTVAEVPGAGNSNGNGFFEPGEKLVITVPLTNSSGDPATGVTLQLVGGGSANYGTINNGVTVAQQVSFTVPRGIPCGSPLTLTFNVNSGLGPFSFTRTVTSGVPTTTFSQNFDGVTAPAIPSGWTATSILGGINFTTVTTSVDTAPNAAFAPDPAANAGEGDLTSPQFAVSATAALVSFRHRYDSEPGWDGGVLEISIANGPFTDIVTAGGTFVSNGYNGTMAAANATPTYTPNPLNGRSGWTGNSGGFITTIIRLPASASGQNVSLRWRFGADDNTSGSGPNPGWYVDTFTVAGSFACPFVPPPAKSRSDFDGDGKTDVTVYGTTDGSWYSQKSGGGLLIQQFGQPGDVPVPGDYDGDGKADVAVYRPSNGVWFIVRSSDSTVQTAEWGSSTAIPAAADFDGDGKTDVAVFGPDSGLWYILGSTSGVRVAQWGNSTSVPVPGDYDGDGKDDVAVFDTSSGLWYIWGSTAGTQVYQWGSSTATPVPGDYDGDGKADVAVYGSGLWYVLESTAGFKVIEWGSSSAIPVPGDYDGDGREDAAVYSDGLWYILGTTSGVRVAQWGSPTAIPIPPRSAP